MAVLFVEPISNVDLFRSANVIVDQIKLLNQKLL